ncbi:MAG: hypothetical protein HC838_09530 [Spirulinaceae cyanobacterium RM2_2_10]|nr:hypothetical protein [Spirulinaceae cyanobacterium RM2_2_10]
MKTFFNLGAVTVCRLIIVSIATVCSIFNCIGQSVSEPRPGWCCPNGQTWDQCGHDCKWIHKYSDGRISRAYEQGCCGQGVPGCTVPCYDYRPNLYFTDFQRQQDGGFLVSYRIDNWDLEDWENPTISLYWETAVTVSGQTVFAKSVALPSKSVGEHQISVSKATLDSAPFGTKNLKLVVDSNNAVNERNEGDNVKRYPMPIRKLDLTWVGMRNDRLLRIEYRQDFGNPDYTRIVKVSATINHKAVEAYFARNNNSFPNEGNDSVEMDLAVLGVPRFQDNVVFDLSVSIQGENILRTKKVAIPLPIIFVPGIDPLSALPLIGSEHVQGGNETFGAFEEYLDSKFESFYGTQSQYHSGSWFNRSYCYLVNTTGYPPGFPVASGSGTSARPYYPSMHTLSFFGENVDRNTVGLFEGGAYLKTAIDTILSRSYADRVNLIAHSKGCLISRGMFAQNYGYGLKVRNAIFIQGPHFGSIAAEDPFAARTILPTLTQYPENVYKNLWPLWTYFKYASDPIRSGKWHSQPGFENPELSRLNQKALPSRSGVNYSILYSNKHRTAYTQRGTHSLGVVFSWGGGDMVVPEFSQRGYVYNANNRKAYNPLNPNRVVGLIPAFVNPVKMGRVSWQKLNSTHVDSMNSPETFEKVWSILWATPVTN